MNHRSKRRMRRAVIAVLLITLALSAVEWWLRSTQFTVAAWLASRPAAYADSPFYGAAFLAERERIPQDFDPLWALRPMNFHGQYFTFQDGVKGTGGTTPTNASRTLYIFGDSTALDNLVPDAYSITGLLQKRLGDSWRVETRAGSGLYSDWELKAVQRVPLKAGDVVIFYDGAEAAAPYWVARDQRLASQSLCPRDSVLYGLQLFWLLCRWAWEPDAVYDDPAWLAREAQQTAQRHQANIAAAAAYVEARGARFVNVLHPYVWTMALSDAERRGVAAIGHSNRIGESYNAVYPLMNGKWTVDLSHALDDTRARGVAVYLDAYHLADRGDAIMAEAVWQVLAPSLEQR